MDRAVGSITICIPMSNLESVKGKLLTTYQREQSDEDINIKRILSENIKNIPVDFVVELGRATISAGEVMELVVGDIIQLERRTDDLLPAFVAGERKYMGTPGVHRGNNALLIQKKVIDPNRE
jgi:flagellar motor switch protein FliM